MHWEDPDVCEIKNIKIVRKSPQFFNSKGEFYTYPNNNHRVYEQNGYMIESTYVDVDKYLHGFNKHTDKVLRYIKLNKIIDGLQG
jgi:hypothetical protein